MMAAMGFTTCGGHFPNPNPSIKINHPFLHPVDPGNTTIPTCHDALPSWANRLPAWFSDPAIPNPKAVALAGLPGAGWVGHCSGSILIT
jgi:hypothetical protein